MKDFSRKFKIPNKIPNKLKSHIKKFWCSILKFKGYRYVVRKVGKMWANFGKFCSKYVFKPYYEEKQITTLQLRKANK